MFAIISSIFHLAADSPAGSGAVSEKVKTDVAKSVEAGNKAGAAARAANKAESQKKAARKTTKPKTEKAVLPAVVQYLKGKKNGKHIRDIATHLGFDVAAGEQDKARGRIDAARRAGYRIENKGNGVFALVAVTAYNVPFTARDPEGAAKMHAASVAKAKASKGKGKTTKANKAS